MKEQPGFQEFKDPLCRKTTCIVHFGAKPSEKLVGKREVKTLLLWEKDDDGDIVNGVQELTSACEKITSKAFKNQEAPSCNDKC